MKGVLVVLLLLGGSVHPADAQGRLVRGDVSGTLGWFSADRGGADRYDDWHSRTLVGDAGVGWYWTDHWKTEIMAGASTEATVYTSITLVQNGQQLYAPSRIRLATRRLSVTQQYQFGDNQWFHGYLGAGIDGVWQRSSRRDEPLYAYDPVTRQGRLVRDAVEQPERTDPRALGAAVAGFKAYFTRRGFFRTDLRVTFDADPEEVALRFGFGMDF